MLITATDQQHDVDTRWSDYTISTPPRRIAMPTVTHTTSRIHRLGHEWGVPVALALASLTLLWVLW